MKSVLWKLELLVGDKPPNVSPKSLLYFSTGNFYINLLEYAIPAADAAAAAISTTASHKKIRLAKSGPRRAPRLLVRQRFLKKRRRKIVLGGCMSKKHCFFFPFSSVDFWTFWNSSLTCKEKTDILRPG